GYTFVGNGTFASAVKRLQHEAEVYSRLEPLQGHFVAACLGSIALHTPYPLAAATILHMLLMSWTGEAVKMNDNFPPGELIRLQERLRTHGVVHNDMRRANLLWNHERGHIMLIDFDLAEMLPVVRHRQVVRFSQKRKRHQRDHGTDQLLGRPRRLEGLISHDSAGYVV
ncbi:hypothetical protein EDB81DRAFT_656054, partial [Dactylonectria macrodidyma]